VNDSRRTSGLLCLLVQLSVLLSGRSAFGHFNKQVNHVTICCVGVASQLPLVIGATEDRLDFGPTFLGLRPHALLNGTDHSVLDRNHPGHKHAINNDVHPCGTHIASEVLNDADIKDPNQADRDGYSQVRSDDRDFTDSIRRFQRVEDPVNDGHHDSECDR
jgi:hypothetical protein